MCLIPAHKKHRQANICDFQSNLGHMVLFAAIFSGAYKTKRTSVLSGLMMSCLFSVEFTVLSKWYTTELEPSLLCVCMHVYS